MTDEVSEIPPDPKEGVTQSEGVDADAVGDIQQPTAGDGLSQYAIAALVIGAVGLWLSPQAFFPPIFPPFDGLGWRAILSGLLPPLLPSIGASIVALWAASRAAREISGSESRLSGVGFYRSGRVLAGVTLAILALSVAVRFLGVDPYGFQEDGSVEVDGIPPPPGTPEFPAQPARPAP